jgi:hypothetical protein
MLMMQINGNSAANREFIEALSKSFKVKTLGGMDKFAGCHIIDTTDKNGVWIHQTKLLKNLKANFMNLVKENTRVFKAPSVPSFLIISPKEGDPLISPEKQKQCSMGVGMLFYLVKHSCPEISNSVRELSKVADGATEGHFNALICTFKYVIGTEDLGLQFLPNFNNEGFYLEGISDSEYAAEPNTRICVYG